MVFSMRHYCMKATAVNASSKKENLFTSRITLPCIANVASEHNASHFVVLYEIKENSVSIADPDKGLIQLDRNSFLKIWHGNLIITIPTDEFTPDDKEDIKPAIILLNMFLSEKKASSILFLMSLILSICGIVYSYYYQLIIDHSFPSDSVKKLIIISTGFLGLLLFQALIKFFRGIFFIKFGNKLTLQLMVKYYGKIIKLPMSFFVSRDSGEILARYKDISYIQETITSVAISSIIDCVMLICSGIALCVISVRMFLSIVPFCFLFILIATICQKNFHKLSAEMLQADQELNTYLIQSVNSIETIKTYHVEDEANNNAINFFDNVIEKLWNSSYFGNIQENIQAFLRSFATISAVFFGGVSVMKNEASIGEFFTGYALVSFFLDPVERLALFQPTLQRTLNSVRRLYEILSLKTEDERDKGASEYILLKKEIKLENVKFRYGKRRLILNNLNISFSKGEKTALIGKSGSGKTSVARLLMRFYEPEAGIIMFDGTDIKDYTLKSLRNKITYVSQNVSLIPGTLRDNLCIKKSKISDTKLDEICEIFGLTDFIKSLPNSYNSIITEGGNDFSEGQKQRISIIRALLSEPDILILDESTSSLDAFTESSIMEYIKSLTELTVIIIAHRLSTIIGCDKIYVLENGTVVEAGNHNELIDKHGVYSEMLYQQKIINERNTI